MRLRSGIVPIIPVALIAGTLLFSGLQALSLQRESALCESSHSDTAGKIECWLELVYRDVRAGNLEAAFRTFGYIYRTYPLFGATGCHTHAHKVGDVAYYEYFVAQGAQLSDIAFPQATSACGYGFFHGFIEHYIQARPDAAFAKETCEYLKSRYTPILHDMDLICYHASGHGFTQASVETIQRSEWGDLGRIVNRPLESCEWLEGVSDAEREECKEGVFNVVNEWMMQGNFGLSLNKKSPFSDCMRMHKDSQYACIYEYAQNVLSITGLHPIRADEITSSIPDTEVRHMAFGVIVAGMMQSTVSSRAHEPIFRECTLVKDADTFRFCIISLVNGMMEHGEPGREYKTALSGCTLPELSSRGGTSLCYSTLIARLPRFYTPEQRVRICAEFPSSEQGACLARQ